MKIHYITNLSNFNKTGVAKKIIGILNSFSKKNVSVNWVLILPENELNGKEIPFKNYTIIEQRNGKYANKLCAYLSTTSHEDILFFRYPVGDEELLKVCNTYGNRIIFEFNSILENELKLKLREYSLRDYLYMFKSLDFSDLKYNLTTLLNEMKFRNNILNLVAGGITVTSEIGIQLNKNLPNFKFITVGNGIDFNNIKQHILPDFDGTFLNILMICSHPNPWHGSDRLIEGLINYNGNIKITLNLVGRFSSKIQNLAQKISHKHSILFHGFLNSEQIEGVKSKCHIAIGSLALHRIPLEQGSVLKVREYLASGIPVALSYYDEDVFDSELTQYCLKLEPNDSPINMGDLISYYSCMHNKKDLTSCIRKSASEVLSFDVKTKEYLAGFETIYAKN